MLTPYLPYPLLSGGQIRTYNLLKNLAKHHEITLFSFIRNENERQHKDELLKYCTRVEMFKRRPAWSLVNIFLAGMTPFPFLVSIYYSRTLQRAIEQELRKNQYHVIHSETFYVMPNIPKTSVPILLVEQTIEFLVYKHFVETVFILLRPLLSLDVAKIRFWETFYWKRAQRVVAMSASDEIVMKKEVPDLKVDIIPNGVDTDEFLKLNKQSSQQHKTILFVGNFKWLQNREAALILINEIWPKIKERLPNAKLWIVGRYPPNEIMNKIQKDITISTDIDDIKEVYTASDILLAPIFGPGGTRYKILEAMASGIPVITTSCGIEGLAARNGKDVVIRDRVQDLASATIEVLQNIKLYNTLAQNGKKLIRDNYSWKQISQRLNLLYKDVGSKDR